MSHLAPQAAIFSPSVARAAASTAKDWAYVDAWLRRQYSHLRQQDNTSSSKQTTATSPPTFERNPETLEALLALVAANEEADEERDRLARLESAALDEVRAAEEEKNHRRQQQQEQNTSPNDTPTMINGDILASDLLEAIDAGLTKDGQTALDAMADISLCFEGLSPADPSAANLAQRFVSEQARAHETEHLLHRVSLLQTYLDDESARLSSLLEELRLAPQYQLPHPHPSSSTTDEDPIQATHSANTTLSTTIKSQSARLPEIQKRVLALEETVGVPPLTIEDVRADERAYLALLAVKKDLDAQVRAFAGLPPDVEAARVELDGLRRQLREATESRDANFEMLVERESPVKVRTMRR